MSSKIEKQKQIFSLLNTSSFQKIQAARGESEEDPGKAPAGNDPRYRLINQVYHFHKSIIQNINAGLVTIDLSGEITFANRSAGLLLGYETAEILGKNIKDFFCKTEDGEKFLNHCAITGKKIDEWESKFIKKNHQEILVEINASPIHDVSNQFEGVVLLVRDITEIHNLRNQVERMEQLALLGELSAGIAHEIRNPLAGIKAATQLLEENFHGDNFQIQLIKRIIREVDKANLLLKEFFKFARPTKPKFAFHDVGDIIKNVSVLLTPRLRKAQIDFIQEIEPDLPMLFVDETQIEQVILNLFLNAIDAMPEGGILRVAAYPKTSDDVAGTDSAALSLISQKVSVCLEISDNGKGIASENISKIFNPFFTTKADGLGLGLSICSRLVAENHGKIDVRSRGGEGTTFLLILPATDRSA